MTTATRRPRRKRARPEHEAPWPWLSLASFDAISGGMVQAATIGEPDSLGRVPVTLALLLPSADYIPSGLRELASIPAAPTTAWPAERRPTMPTDTTPASRALAKLDALAEPPA